MLLSFLFWWLLTTIVIGFISALCEGSSRTGILILWTVCIILYCAVMPFLWGLFPWHPANEKLDVFLWIVYSLFSIAVFFVVLFVFEDWLEKRRERKIKERQKKSMSDGEKAPLSKETGETC